jgi:phosphate:Na+ symporter
VSTELLLAAGGLGLLLIGMRMLTEGLRQVAGAWLARTLARGTRSPARGALLGAGMTALVQSSSATTVAAVGFVGAGVLSFPQALGIIFGANVGTTATGWMVALFGFRVPLGAVAQALALAGGLLLLLGSGRASSIGRAIAGFALVLLGLESLKSGFTGVQELINPAALPADTWGGRSLLALIGAAVTVVTQSSTAGVATCLAALHAGTLTLGQAGALVLGMEVGTSCAALIASLGGSLAMRRTGASHLVFNALSAAPAFVLLPWYVGAMAPDPAQAGLALVIFHTGTNLGGALIAVPLAGRFARLMEWLIPERPRGARRMDPSVAREATVAIPAAGAALRRTARLAAGLAESMSLQAPADVNQARGLTQPVRAELEVIREDLGSIATTPQQVGLHAAHVSLLHAVDHLDRLLDRLEEVPVPEARAEPHVLAWVADFAALARTVERGAPGDPLVAARNCAEGMATRAEVARQELMADAARGEREPRNTLASLDEMRRIEHMAHHIWRALHHLADAPG